MRAWIATVVLPLTALMCSPVAARAQGALVHASAAAAVSDGTTSPAFGGGITYRFNRVLGLGVELMHIRSLGSDMPHIYYCCDDDRNARLTTFTTNVRLEIPTTSTRVVPFVVAGGGVAGLTQSYGIAYARMAERLGPRLSAVPFMPEPSTLTTTTTNMALTLGGGASFLLSDHVAIDADLRILHVMGADHRNIGRFGAGVSFRF